MHHKPYRLQQDLQACAIKPVAESRSIRSLRLPRLFVQLPIARSDGSYATLMNPRVKTDLLIDPGWLGNPETEAARRQVCKAANSSPSVQRCFRQFASARILMIYTI